MSPTDKRQQAEAGLSPELLEVLNILVEDYRVAANVHTGRDFFDYNILADLVRAGWRKIDGYSPD